MDIKDSYLHGTVGVVKSISVSADKLKYTLADINNTAKTITLPLATKDANGLMSSTDKVKLDAFTSPDNYVKWDGTSAAYYNIFQKSNNSEGHVRAIFYDKDGNSVFGYGYNSSNKQAYITNYTYSKDLYLGNGILTYGGRTVAFIDSDIAADKLKKSVKLWGLDFDGSDDVSGNMIGVGTINHNFKVVNTQDNIATLNVESTAASSAENYIHLYVNSNSGGSTTRPLVLQNNYGNVGIGVSNPTYKLEVNGNVKATSFIGNLDGKYVNKLTDYTKATSPSAISNNDSLNKALGKLEYKADTAYDLVKGAYDGDGTIENLAEILKVLEGIKDTDVLNNLMQKYRRLDTSQFYENEVISKFYINRAKEGGGGWSYCPWLVYKADKTSVLSYFGVYGAANSLTYTFIGANTYDSTENLRIYPNGNVSATSFKTINGTSSLFVKGDGSLDHNTYATTTLLGNYLPLTGGTLTGNLWFGAGNTDKYITFTSATTGTDSSNSWRIGYIGSGSGDENQFVLQSTKYTTDTWTNALSITNDKLIATFAGIVIAPTFLGNLAYTYLTGSGSIKDLAIVSTGTTNGWTLKTLGSNAFSSTAYLPLTGGTLTGDLSLYVESGDSPSLIFQRGGIGTTDVADWKLLVINGLLKFQYADSTLNSGLWASIIKFSSKGIMPDSNNIDLGSSSNKWKNVYAETFIGNVNGNATTANTLKSITIISSKAFNLSNASWIDAGYSFTSLTTGTYAIQVTSGSNLVASGIMSVYKNLSDTAGDEIPLHVYGTAGWRPYLRTYANKLLISSNDASATSRTVTIKIAQIL